jgi:hypothetical protein
LGSPAAVENADKALDFVAVPLAHVYDIMRLVSFSSEQFLRNAIVSLDQDREDLKTHRTQFLFCGSIQLSCVSFAAMIWMNGESVDPTFVCIVSNQNSTDKLTIIFETNGFLPGRQLCGECITTVTSL